MEQVSQVFSNISQILSNIFTIFEDSETKKLGLWMMDREVEGLEKTEEGEVQTTIRTTWPTAS